MAKQTLLSHHGNSIAWVQDIVARVLCHISVLSFLLALVLVLWIKRTPMSSEIKPQAASTWCMGPTLSIGCFKHINVAKIPLSWWRASFSIFGNARCEIILVKSVILEFLLLNLITELGVFMTEPVQNLLAPERNLAG